MNYLGHAWLSPGDPQILIGNLAGDSVRGVPTEALPLGIQQGLRLHEAIDAATDGTKEFAELRGMLEDAELPYAGVLADLLIDFALASRWETLASEPFDRFKQRIYRALAAGAGLVSTRFYFTAAVLTAEDWFESYRSEEGMGAAFFRLNRKTRRPLPLEEIALLLQRERARIIDLSLNILTLVEARLRETGTFPLVGIQL